MLGPGVFGSNTPSCTNSKLWSRFVQPISKREFCTARRLEKSPSLRACINRDLCPTWIGFAGARLTGSDGDRVDDAKTLVDITRIAHRKEVYGL